MTETESVTLEKPAQNKGGNPNAADAAVQHGLYRAIAILERGLSVIPADSPLYAVIAEHRNQIVNDAGGKDSLSALRLDLVEQYLTTMILISSVDSYLMALERPKISTRSGRELKPIGIVDRRSHKLRPIIEQRNKLIKTSMELAQAIGLDRKQPPEKTLSEYLAEKAKEQSQTQPEGETKQ